MRYWMVLLLIAACDSEPDLAAERRRSIAEGQRRNAARLEREAADRKAAAEARRLDDEKHKATMAELTRPKTKAEKAALARQAVADRKAMADALEKSLREGGLVVMVTTRGRDHSRMVIEWDGCSAAWLDTLTDDSEVQMSLRRVGFKRVDCETSFDVSFVKL